MSNCVMITDDSDVDDEMDIGDEEYTLPHLDLFFVEWLFTRADADEDVTPPIAQAIADMLAGHLSKLFPDTDNIEVEATITDSRVCFSSTVYGYFNQDLVGRIQKVARALAVGVDVETVTYSILNDAQSMGVDITYVELNPHLTLATCTFE